MCTSKYYLCVYSVPHITLSVALDAHTVDTGKLAFSPVAPFVLEAVFGGYIENVGVDTEKRAENG